MSVILIYVVLVVAGDAIAVAISTVVEHFSKSASLLVFFALFIAVFWVSWVLAVRITERYLIRAR
jgi:hypothetical protein